MTFLALWGAVLSTLLAGVKILEVWRDRFRIDVAYNFNDAPEVGNEILVRNLAAIPIIVSYWELVWLSGSWPFRTESMLISPEGEVSDIRIDARSTQALTFTEENHFNWEPRNGRRLYIRLWVAGRRPLLRKVYG
jgi:hypothetical protein